MSGAAPAFEFVEAVTSDLSFVARGATLDEAFAAAAEALLAATVEDPQRVASDVVRRVTLREPDLELLLLGFLNELIYLRDAELLLLRARRVTVSQLDGAALDAELVGERMDPTRHRLACEVKAATAYGLRVAENAGGWEVRVTLDV